MHGPLTVDQANAVFDILVERAGAPEHLRAEFVHHQTDRHCREFRFQGLLGLGGKFYRDRWLWQVFCYPEDATAERCRVVAVTNAALSGLRATYAALDAAMAEEA